MRRTIRLLLPLLVLLPLAGCGSDSGGASPMQVVASAAEATTATSTAQFTFEMAMTAAGQDLSFTGTGAIDFEAKRSSMTIDMGQMFQQMGLGDVDGNMTMRMDGTTIYLRSGLFDQIPGFSTDGKWLKMDLADASATPGLDLSQLQQPGTDPSQQLAMLEGVAEDGVEEVGHEEVGGVDTTHYRAEVDLAKAARKAGAITDPEAFQKLVDSMGSKTIQVNVWIDGDKRVRRMVIPMTVHQQGQTAKVKITMGYDHFGDPVDVAVPPADQVLDYKALLNAAGAGTGD